MFGCKSKRGVLIMTKRFLVLLAVIVMVSLAAVACKKRVTNPVASFSTEEVVTPDDSVTPDEEGLKPISGLTIDANKDLTQFENYTFVNADGGVATIKFDQNYYVSVSGIHSIVKINGRLVLPDGSVYYQGSGPAAKGAKYVLLANKNRADVTFTSDGYMTVAIYGGATTKYALQSK